VSKVALRMLFLSRSDPLLPEFPPFMLDVFEVVDSLVKLPKCVRTGNEQEREASAQNRVNRTVRFCQLQRHSGASSAPARASFSRPIDV
jgi:hypothetical protein